MLTAAATNTYGIGTLGPKASLWAAGEDVEAEAAAEDAADTYADADAAAADAAARLCTLLEIVATVVAFRSTAQGFEIAVLFATTGHELLLLIWNDPPSWGHVPTMLPRSGSGLPILTLKIKLPVTGG